MRTGVLGALLVTVALTATTGCQRLNFSKKLTLSPMVVHQLEFTRPAYNQRVTVKIAPTSTAVSAYLVKTDDASAVDRALHAGKEPAASLLLGSRVSTGQAETYTFEATVPAKVDYTLMLKPGTKSTDVVVTVTGR
jgi:hypothetical protein